MTYELLCVYVCASMSEFKLSRIFLYPIPLMRKTILQITILHLNELVKNHACSQTNGNVVPKCTILPTLYQAGLLTCKL